MQHFFCPSWWFTAFILCLKCHLDQCNELGCSGWPMLSSLFTAFSTCTALTFPTPKLLHPADNACAANSCGIMTWCFLFPMLTEVLSELVPWQEMQKADTADSNVQATQKNVCIIWYHFKILLGVWSKLDYLVWNNYVCFLDHGQSVSLVSPLVRLAWFQQEYQLSL
jgi:hypothetical protein